MKLLIVDTWNCEVHIFDYPNDTPQDPENAEFFITATKAIYTPFGDCHWQFCKDIEIKIHP
jgi:hypothetical protein